MKNLITLITFVLVLVAASTKVNAQALDGSYTVTQGSTVTVQIGAAYQRTLAGATNVFYTWSAANSSIAIQSKTSTTCTIKGVTPTDNVRLNYQCSYRYDGYARSMNFYYDITVKSNTISVNRVYVYPEETTLNLEETLQLTTEIYPANATNRSLRWQTDNYNIASVSSSGFVTARGSGKVKVWAYAQDGSGAADYCIVTVNDPTKVESIELEKETLVLNVGDMFSLEATVSPGNAYNKSLSWTSSDNDVATVADGNITAVGSGECDIICSSTDGSNISATCHVTVNEAPRYWLTVNVPNGSYSMDVTDMEEITIKITPEDGYRVHSFTLNGDPVTTDPTTNTLTLMKLENDAILNAVVEHEISTDVQDIAQDNDNISVKVIDHTITVCGIAPGRTIYVYNIQGSLITSTSNASFELPNNGVYILHCNNRTFKIAI